MKIAEGEFQPQPSEENSSAGTGVSPVNDGQDARPTKIGQSPEDRHSRVEHGNERIPEGGFSGKGQDPASLSSTQAFAGETAGKVSPPICSVGAGVQQTRLWKVPYES